MRVAVLGGTGTLGTLVVAELRDRGHEARVLSRHGHGRAQVDLMTGAGLPDALAGAEAVIDASNSTRRARAVLVEGTGRLLRAELEAGVEHHVLISIAGIDELPFGYYRCKLEQERLVRESEVPATVLRATQFHQLLEQVFAGAARFGVLPGGSIPIQPVDPREVAILLVDAVDAGPLSLELRSLAGPEVASLSSLARTWMAATGRRRVRVPIPVPGAGGRALRGGALADPQAPRGTVTFARWLSERTTAPGARGGEKAVSA